MRCFPGRIGAGFRTFDNSGQMDKLIPLLYIYFLSVIVRVNTVGSEAKSMRGGVKERTALLGAASQNAV